MGYYSRYAKQYNGYAKQINERCFTFDWKFENVKYFVQKKGEPIKSPAFLVDGVEGTKWNLWLYPRGGTDENNFDCHLHREANSKGADSVRIKYDFAFIGKDGAVLVCSERYEKTFEKNQFARWKNLGRQDVIESPSFLLRCRLWMHVGDMLKDLKCTILTYIGVEKRSLKCNLKNFSTRDFEKKMCYQIKSIHNNLPLMSINLSLTGRLSFEEKIHFDISLQDETIKFSTLRLFLINGSGNRVECNEEEMWFDYPTSCTQFEFRFTKKKLLQDKNIYLPNDTLSLIWEWRFSRGVISESVKEDVHGCICSEFKVSDALNINNEQTTVINCMADNMKSLYEERFLSDVKLQTKTNEFPAHKFILSASSSVFKNTFSCEMKEKTNNCVHIEDLDDDTVSRMLLFMYTTRAEDLTFKSASNLYAAADKYAILTLKNVCSSFFKKNIALHNACEVLLLADSHGDADLKSEVQEYIIKNGKQITMSSEWKDLMGTHPKLAAETVCQVFK